ncbi:glycosyltransferase family 2 protein [Methylococcus sp. EFPC2]|uniref:glycosyltransferase family 2 protein n=1 Tax=Methylococcus sp. EFPC2 TaxID=2812648 RepID=UPI0019678549|nr:glycosyltransferase family 2 protein [Methylococcus sp. EFPC2]QSA96841.1 glycosyltransferase family 2 protein [Methylococcus sp. EFPC2]
MGTYSNSSFIFPGEPSFSIVIPAKNESASIGSLVRQIKGNYPSAQVLVIDDGSTDNTFAEAQGSGAEVVRHPRSLGNGAAIKTGARKAKGEVIVFMDADGQHDPADIPKLLEKISEGYYMVVGARSSRSQASFGRRIANGFYNRLASVMTGYRILDLTSGFRAVKARRFRKFLYLLPNGFSYPTTSTMAFFRAGFPVAYVPIQAGKRQGKSKIRLLHDGARFFLIILKIGALFSPMRFFLPISLFLFSSGTGLYAYNYVTQGRFTNMSLLLFMSALFTFLIGILSEQISSLHYRGIEGSPGEPG